MTVALPPAPTQPPAFGTPHAVPDAEAAQRLALAFRDYPTPTLYELHRTADPSATSGTGRMTTGVIWPGGAAVQRWSAPRPPAGYPYRVRQLDEFDSIAEVMAVHGHQGATQIVLLDPLTGAGEGDQAVPDVFAVTAPEGDVEAWGCWWPDTDRTAIYRPEHTAIAGRRQVFRLATYRSLSDVSADLPAPSRGGQHRLVWLTRTTGERLVDRVRAAFRARWEQHQLARRAAASAPLIGRDELLAQLGRRR
jgi:hypothetical protein